MKTKKCKFILVESAEPIGLGSLCKDPSFGLGSIVMEHGEECFHIARANGKGSITTPWKRNLSKRLVHYNLVLISLDPEDKIDVRDKYYDEHNNLVSIASSQSDHIIYKYKKVIATQDQISPQDIQKAIEQYNANGEFEDVEIEMKTVKRCVRCSAEYSIEKEYKTCQYSYCGYNLYLKHKPKLTNNFITILEKERGITIIEKPSKRLSEQPLYNSVDGKPLYTEDEMFSYMQQYLDEYVFTNNTYITPQDWFENNKKK